MLKNPAEICSEVRNNTRGSSGFMKRGEKDEMRTIKLKILLVYFFFYPLGRYAGVVWFYLNEYILLSCDVFQKFRCELRQIYNFFLFRGFCIMKTA